VTSTVPEPRGGATAVIREALSTTNDDAAVSPKLTVVAPVKSDPLIVTVVPPPKGPAVGASAVTVGATS
jgi:hypothetical protein